MVEIPTLDGDDDAPNEETLLHRELRPLVVRRTDYAIRWRDGSGQQTRAIEERMLVGSANRAELVLADRLVSKFHAELDPAPEGLWIRDLESRNGTHVQGMRVAAAIVPDGAVIRVGTTELTVHYGGPTVRADLWPESGFGPLLGASEVMREMFARLARISATDSSVLVAGETGTGKELVAAAIHDASARAAKPFVIVDCAALSEQLLEAELFGHAKGAFTGASSARVGAFESAEGGTVFLDEVGELPLSMQPKLLRVLESKTIRRLGESHQRPVDVRVLSATHRDLRTMVNAGAFREDLYFRLAVLPVRVPPLRERVGDIPLLVERFLSHHPASSQRVPLEDLGDRPWFGNVRELRNYVERALALGGTEARSMRSEFPPPAARSSPETASQRPVDLGATGAESSLGNSLDAVCQLPFKTFRERWMDRGEREYVHQLLQRHGGNVAAAAQFAEVDRTYLYKLIRKQRI